MLFRMRSNMLFRLFPLLTAQAGFAPVDTCLISENCYIFLRSNSGIKYNRKWGCHIQQPHFLFLFAS